jgi:hypothetical protein
MSVRQVSFPSELILNYGSYRQTGGSNIARPLPTEDINSTEEMQTYTNASSGIY